MDEDDGLIDINEANEDLAGDTPLDGIDGAGVEDGDADVAVVGADDGSKAGHSVRNDRRAAVANRGISSSAHAIMYSINGVINAACNAMVHDVINVRDDCNNANRIDHFLSL